MPIIKSKQEIDANSVCDINPATNGLTCTTDGSLRTNELLIDSITTASTTDITATIESSSLECITSLRAVTYNVGTS